MSAFEDSPEEIRYMIYHYSLLHNGDIIPHPTDYKPIEIKSKGYIPTKKPTSADLSVRVSARLTVSYVVNVYSPSQLSCSKIGGAKSIPVI